jgi:MYXO-CTERM domain-containing protein
VLCRIEAVRGHVGHQMPGARGRILGPRHARVEAPHAPGQALFGLVVVAGLAPGRDRQRLLAAQPVGPGRHPVVQVLVEQVQPPIGEAAVVEQFGFGVVELLDLEVDVAIRPSAIQLLAPDLRRR